MKDDLTSLVEVGSRHNAEYIEIRAQTLSKTMLTMKDGVIEAAKEGRENGVAIRVLVDGTWGFASVGSFDKAKLKDAVEKACRMAKATARKVKTPIKLAETKTVEDKVVYKPKKNPAEIPLSEKIHMASSINKTLFSYDPRIKSCTIDYLDVTGTDHFINNDGTYIEQDKLYVWSRILAVAKEGEVFAFARDEVGSTSGFEVFETQTPETIGERVAKRVAEQLKAKTPKGGVFPVVIGPNVVGVFVHEAFGHLAEADLTLSGSVLIDKLGKKVASDVVTVYDDGTIEGAFGSFKYDDEGIPAQKTLLIKDGQIVGFMHSRETAYKFKTSPTGNVRAEDFRYEPIIRMRNTYMAPRDHNFEELVEPIKFGYYLKSFRGGQANLDGTFQVGIQEAYEIVNGEVGAPVRNVSISGNTLETLRKVNAVGKDFELWPGRCGKGQIAFVCDGGPHIRVSEVLVGGGA